jgi:hypothetical protein
LPTPRVVPRHVRESPNAFAAPTHSHTLCTRAQLDIGPGVNPYKLFRSERDASSRKQHGGLFGAAVQTAGAPSRPGPLTHCTLEEATAQQMRALTCVCSCSPWQRDCIGKIFHGVAKSTAYEVTGVSKDLVHAYLKHNPSAERGYLNCYLRLEFTRFADDTLAVAASSAYKRMGAWDAQWPKERDLLDLVQLQALLDRTVEVKREHADDARASAAAAAAEAAATRENAAAEAAAAQEDAAAKKTAAAEKVEAEKAAAEKAAAQKAAAATAMAAAKVAVEEVAAAKATAEAAAEKVAAAEAAAEAAAQMAAAAKAAAEAAAEKALAEQAAAQAAAVEVDATKAVEEAAAAKAVATKAAAEEATRASDEAQQSALEAARAAAQAVAEEDAVHQAAAQAAAEKKAAEQAAAAKAAEAEKRAAPPPRRSARTLWLEVTSEGPSRRP